MRNDYSNKYFWSAMPMLRLMLFLAVGISINHLIQLPENLLFRFILVLTVVGYFIGRKHWSGLFFCSLYILAGAWLNAAFAPESKCSAKNLRIKRGEICFAEIDEVKATSRGFRYQLNLLRNASHQRMSGKLLLYTTSSQKFEPGQYILFKYKGYSPRANLLPAGFDFPSWLKKQGIEKVQYAGADDSIKVLNQVNVFKNWFHHIRVNILQIYRTYIGNDAESGVASALLFGIKDHLEAEITEAYATTGTMHVLAVSGLHVGLIFLLSQFITGALTSRILKLFIQLLLLWIYVLVCGAEAAVLRAGIMFSVIAWGQSIKRRTGIYNNLGISGFMILCLNPGELYNAGFLLSYSAVAGIAFLHPMLCNLLTFKNAWIQKGFEFTMVTVAAQIATLPVTLYCFHQFPVYFLISNMLIIPLTTLITYGGILLLVVSPIAGVAKFVGKVVYHLIVCCDEVALRISNWPGACLDQLYLSLSEIIFITFFLISLTIALGLGRKKYLFISGAFLNIFLILNIYNSYLTSIQKKYIYRSNKQANVSLYIRGNASKVYIYFHKKRQETIVKNVKTYLQEQGVKEIKITEKILAKPHQKAVPE